MNLHALRVFHSVALFGSVTKAANELHISQPAVTLQLRNLEKELGVHLVVPHGRGIALTYAGEELEKLSHKLFAVEREITARMEEIVTGIRGELIIAATYLPANKLLPKWIAAFKKAHEHVSIKLITLNTRDAIDKLSKHEADVAVIGGGWEIPGIRWEHLGDDELWFIVHPGHPLAEQEISLQEMMNETFVIREEGSSTRERFLSMCRTYNVNQPKIGMQFSGLNETITAVMAGYGANLISAMAVQDYIQRGEVARVYVKHVDLQRPIAICTLEDNVPTPITQQFIEFIRQNLTVV
ncbi:LysR family transcriptional regulator [Paenibacillus sp. LMG 31456]|uniref:LysR family transcriptional regulator n=1 Tax=Paenibacillus foliorum TaxID=2654974 RepID=A0A972K3I4_9BACL|nr:LysR family transcriptional regulator [Paenibacillus foliorum]NOU95948.1 LysR family transcriptional regulator [Paenibacillus foliorum]